MSSFDRIGIALLCAYAGITATVYAKLPAPSDQEQAAVTARKAAEARETEVQKQLLERSQNDVARRYAAASGRTVNTGAASAQQSSIPRAATQPVQGPHGGDEKSAEAHSSSTKGTAGDAADRSPRAKR